ncbi:MAG: glycerophosphodiester phosphodiesterase family protein [Lachnospiraceae bacterium]|nr:glycerophosphodiester phosphodiesterase family protein [Lachnospiraceae bacterium]
MHIWMYILFIAIVLLLIAMWPGEGRRDRMQTYIRCPIAHRGLHDNKGPAPENSIRAFRLAVEKGYGVELDVRLSSDGQAVVFHDRSLKRAAGIDRNVDDMNWSELRQVKLFGSEERIPLFADVLRVIAGRVPIIMEIKAESVEAAERTSEEAIFLLDSYEGDVCMESFHPAAVRYFRKMRPETLRGQLSEKFSGYAFPHRVGAFALSFCVFNFLTRPDFIAYNVRHMNLMRYRLQHDLFHAVCAAWTVKSEEEMLRTAGAFDILIFEGFEPKMVKSSDEDTAGSAGRTDMGHIIRKRILCSGMVQAVGFRYRSVYIAQSLGLTGFVRNLDDGRVELELQGTEQGIAAMMERLRAQKYIVISGTEEYLLDAVPGEYEFKVRY